MAQVNLISCDFCGDLILTGDIIAITTKGVLAGVGESLDIIEVEGSRPVHQCDSCATETAATLRRLIEDAEVRAMVDQSFRRRP